MDISPDIIQDIGGIYRRLDEQIAGWGSSCRACGKCCDFEAFGHRLYVTAPEAMYFAHHVGRPLMPMSGGVCPYRVDGRCSVYAWRFAGCRIFQCEGGEAQQGALSEAVLAEFKRLCEQYSVPYRYMDLKAALTQ
jgi:Fe-S-cluster containining protein